VTQNNIEEKAWAQVEEGMRRWASEEKMNIDMIRNNLRRSFGLFRILLESTVLSFESEYFRFLDFSYSLLFAMLPMVCMKRQLSHK
jgi:hypothetical protein